MLILLTLSFLQPSGRNSSTLDLLRNIPHEISKKQIINSMNVTKVALAQGNNNSHSESEEFFQNTHDVHVVNNSPDGKEPANNTWSGTHSDNDVISLNVSHEEVKNQSRNLKDYLMRKEFMSDTDSDSNEFLYSPPPRVISANHKPISKKRFESAGNTGKKLTDAGILENGGYEFKTKQPYPLWKVVNKQKAAREQIIPGYYFENTLAPGDVLHGHVLTPHPKPDPYLEGLIRQIKERNTGYLSVGFEELCEIIAFKKPADVLKVVKHLSTIIGELRNKLAHLQWLEEPMSTILHDVAHLISVQPIDELQTRAMIMKSLMHDRRQIVGGDVNLAIDLADNMINAADGERLFRVIIELRKFPNISKSGDKICKDVIEAFEDPFLHLSGSIQLRQMVTAANQAFIDRFPNYSHLSVDKAGTPKITTSKLNAYFGVQRDQQDKTPKKTAVKTKHKVKHHHKTNPPAKILTTRRRKHKPIRPDILLRRRITSMLMRTRIVFVAIFLIQSRADI